LNKKKIIVLSTLAFFAFIYISQTKTTYSTPTTNAPIAESKKTENAFLTILKTKVSESKTPSEAKDRYEQAMTKILQEMPTLTRQSPPKADNDNEVHELQPDEFKEGQKLAELRKLSLENEKFAAATQIIYADCSQRSDLAVSVRAVCFMRAMELSIKLKNPKTIVQLDVPADVRKLALKLVD